MAMQNFATASEAIVRSVDSRNDGMRLGMERGRKAYTYDPITGDLTDIYWTITRMAVGPSEVPPAEIETVWRKTFTWVAGQLTTETDWTLVP